MKEVIEALKKSIQDAESCGDKSILFPVPDAKILLERFPKDGEIEEYFKALGYPEGDLLNRAVSAAKLMFDGNFHKWKSAKQHPPTLEDNVATYIGEWRKSHSMTEHRMARYIIELINPTYYEH
jgi:hypothetical protein